jgi:hypothetical protein
MTPSSVRTRSRIALKVGGSSLNIPAVTGVYPSTGGLDLFTVHISGKGICDPVIPKT